MGRDCKKVKSGWIKKAIVGFCCFFWPWPFLSFAIKAISDLVQKVLPEEKLISPSLIIKRPELCTYHAGVVLNSSLAFGCD